jgi:hypothetical protein
MTTPTNPPGQPDSGEDCPAATSVGGLARDLEALRRDVTALAGLVRRVEEMGQLVTRLAEATTAATTAGSDGVVSWLDTDLDWDDPSVAEAILTRLSAWVAGVYLRYPDANLPDCWLWHPEIIEELLWLHQAWLSAYADGARVTAAADWHDRYRPGVIARLKSTTDMCGLEDHQPGKIRHRPARTAPVLDAGPVIAAWWSTERDSPAPAPSGEQIAAAAQAHRIGARR